MRSPAARAAWRVAFTRERRFTGVYIAKRAVRKETNAPGVMWPVLIEWLP